MEKSDRGIFIKNCFMKKIVAVSASLLLVVVSANSQSEKKEPPPPPKPETVKFDPPRLIDKELLHDFYRRNPSVAQITSERHVTTLKMKDGTTERYDMRKKEDDENFTKKYGVSPIPPPPPPKKVS
jgi:hypothetical protein